MDPATNMEKSILTILSNTQNGRSNHMRSLKQLEKVYKLSEPKQFARDFLKVLQQVVVQDPENRHCKFVLEFAGHFVAHIATTENDAYQGLAHPLVKKPIKALFQELLENKNETFVINTCVFLDSMFTNIGDDIVVDEAIGDYIQNSLIESLEDGKAVVRLQGIIALTRLQNPMIQNCPVIKAFIKCLRDSNYMVRREIVKRVAPNGVTIPRIKEATRDKNVHVRFAAFSHLADIGIKRLKIEQRRFVLKSGFSETDGYAKKAFFECLIPKWLTQLNKSYLKFLEDIKFDADEKDIETTEELSRQLMEVFIKTESIESLIEELALDDSKLVPQEHIKSEIAFYWNILVNFLSENEELDEYLNRTVPELKQFCNYIDSLIEKRYSEPDEFEILDFHHLLYNLFDITDHLDLSEEVGRKSLDKLIKKVLPERRLQPRLLNKLIQIAAKLHPNVESLTHEICIIISEIWQPLTVKPPSALNIQERKYQRAKLVVELDTLQGDLDDVLLTKDYVKAQQLSDEINAKTKELSEFDKQEEPLVETRVSKDDTDTLCWCLDLLQSLLQYGGVETLTDSLKLCREEFLMPLIVKRNIEICWRAFQCLACYCVFDKDLAEEHHKALCAPILSFGIVANVHPKMLVTSLQVVTDLIIEYGSDLFEPEDTAATSNTIDNTVGMRRLYNNEDAGRDDSYRILDERLTTENFLNVVLNLLDNDEVIEDLRDAAITCIAKLMLNHFPIDSMIITRLVLRWYSPTTPDTFQQKIGVTLQAYADRIVTSREIVAKAIIPTLNHVADAPRTSPLAEVDIENLINFMCAMACTKQAHGLLHIQREIARSVLHEISCRPTSGATVYFAKVLDQLTIVPNDSPAIKDLIASSEVILEKETLDRMSKRRIEKFRGKLLNEPGKSTATSINTTSASNTTNITESVRQSLMEIPRRLSQVIEEASSEETNEQDDVTPAKRRRIEVTENVNDGGKEMEITCSNSDNVQQTTASDHVGHVENRAENLANNNVNKTCETRTERSSSQSSKSSDSDVIPSSQDTSGPVGTRAQNRCPQRIPRKSKRKRGDANSSEEDKCVDDQRAKSTEMMGGQNRPSDVSGESGSSSTETSQKKSLSKSKSSKVTPGIAINGDKNRHSEVSGESGSSSFETSRKNTLRKSKSSKETPGVAINSDKNRHSEVSGESGSSSSETSRKNTLRKSKSSKETPEVSGESGSSSSETSQKKSLRKSKSSKVTEDKEPVNNNSQSSNNRSSNKRFSSSSLSEVSLSSSSIESASVGSYTRKSARIESKNSRASSISNSTSPNESSSPADPRKAEKLPLSNGKRTRISPKSRNGAKVWDRHGRKKGEQFPSSPSSSSSSSASSTNRRKSERFELPTRTRFRSKSRQVESRKEEKENHTIATRGLEVDKERCTRSSRKRKLEENNDNVFNVKKKLFIQLDNVTKDDAAPQLGNKTKAAKMINPTNLHTRSRLNRNSSESSERKMRERTLSAQLRTRSKQKPQKM